MLCEANRETMAELNAPEACVRYALTMEDPPYPCIRVVLSHGTYVDLVDDMFSADGPGYAALRMLFERAYAGGYDFTDEDRAILLRYIAPYLADEWTAGNAGDLEGGFEAISSAEFDDDAAPDEPAGVLLTQRYTGDHHEVSNLIFNWYMEIPGAEVESYKMALHHRRMDSENPQIAAIVVATPQDFE